MVQSKWKTLRLLRKNESGQTMVETALSATLFLLFMFGTINFGYLYYGKVTLQNAVRQAGRYAITGNCGSGNCFQNGNNGNRLNTIVQTVQNYSFNLSPTVSVTCTGTCPSYSGNGGAENAGGPGDVVQISATYTFSPIFVTKFFPSGGYTYTVSSVFKNELFPPPSD